jgi:hypothetical protein
LGGSITSHYGIHCVLNEIPYIVTDIKSGDILDPTAKTIKRANRDAIMAGVEKGLANAYLPASADALRIVLASLHNYPLLDHSNTSQMQFFGLGVGMCIRLAMAALLGEMRYLHHKSYDALFFSRNISLTREHVFHNSLGCGVNYILDKTYRLTPWFGHPQWAVGSGVGGFKWLECGRVSFMLWNAVCAFNEKGTKENLKTVSARLNRVINICHNASKLLTKFGNSSLFDLARDYPSHPLTTAAPIIYDLIKFGRREENVQYVPYDLPDQKWHAETINKRRRGY